MTRDIHSLFAGAHAGGEISDEGLEALMLDADLGAHIDLGMGIDPDDVEASEVVLVQLLLDDSASMQGGGNDRVLREAVNDLLLTLESTRENGGVLVAIRTLNGAVVSPFNQLSGVPRLDARNYQATGHTPLYEQMALTLATVLAKTAEFADAGVPVRSITAVFTDGADSTGQSPARVAKIARDMLAAESHLVLFVGIDDGATDFRQVARGMGIPDHLVKTPGSTPGEFRAACRMVTQTVVRASQVAAYFGQTRLGGFATN